MNIYEQLFGEQLALKLNYCNYQLLLSTSGEPLSLIRKMGDFSYEHLSGIFCIKIDFIGNTFRLDVNLNDYNYSGDVEKWWNFTKAFLTLDEALEYAIKTEVEYKEWLDSFRDENGNLREELFECTLVY